MDIDYANGWEKVPPVGRVFALVFCSDGRYCIGQWDPPLKKWFIESEYSRESTVIAWHNLPNPPKGCGSYIDSVTHALQDPYLLPIHFSTR